MRKGRRKENPLRFFCAVIEVNNNSIVEYIEL